MATRTTAEEHLRVIRSLMEKATIYRAISAPTALVGGCAGILAATIFVFQSRNLGFDAQAEGHLFLACWLGALGIAAVGNVYFLRADARRRGEKFVSAGMRAALRSLWPSYIAAAAFTILKWRFPGLLVIPWILFYGLGLLGTQHFAPRSIVLLGWAFLAAALVVMIGCYVIIPAMQRSVIGYSVFRETDGSWLVLGNLAMGITFGGFHLIYAICTWPRGARVTGAQSAAVDAGNAP